MSGRRGMVVGPQPEAVEAGVDILQAGGNAVDAAVAAAFVQTVVDPLMCGIAGFGSAAVYLPESGEHEYVDFHAPAPRKVSPEMWADVIKGEARDGFGFILEGHVNELGYQAICTPASLRAYHDMHAAHGLLPWPEVLAPAVAWATEGWPVRPHVHQYWSEAASNGHAANTERLAHTPAGRKLYCRPDGTPKTVGDVVRNGDYAEVLRQVARDGPEVFYTGDIAHAMVADIERHGGLLGLDDLRSYRVRSNDPLWGDYRGHRIATNQPPGGGVTLVEMLNVLEHFDLAAMGHNSAAYVSAVAEAMKRATVDKDRFVADPAFADVPVERLISAEHARAAAESITLGERAEVPRYRSPEASDTTHLSVVDAAGNCVSITHSLGMSSGVISDGLGFMYNGCMGLFDPRPGRAGSIEPGKARVSSMCPSIVFRDGAVRLVVGAPGGTQITMGVLQVILNVLDFRLGMTEAVSRPRFSGTSTAIDVANRIPRAVTRELTAQGYEVVRSPLSYAFAAVHGIAVDSQGELDGAADPSRDGMALATDGAGPASG